MAGRKFKGVNSLENRMVVVAGNFSTIASPVLNEGNGVTVTRNATGDYTLTLDDSYPAVLSMQATLEVPTGIAADEHGVDIGAIDASAGTYKVRVWKATSNVLADLTDGVCHFAIFLRNSSL